MNNMNFIKIIKDKNISMYRLSKNTGIPYTTINEIYNGKIDINKCSVDTVQKLALEFHVSITELLNPIYYLENVHGQYKNIKYIWKKSESGNMNLEFYDNNKKIILDGEAKYVTPDAKKLANICAEILIEQYFKKKEMEAQMEALL